MLQWIINWNYEIVAGWKWILFSFRTKSIWTNISYFILKFYRLEQHLTYSEYKNRKYSNELTMIEHINPRQFSYSTALNNKINVRNCSIAILNGTKDFDYSEKSLDKSNKRAKMCDQKILFLETHLKHEDGKKKYRRAKFE